MAYDVLINQLLTNLLALSPQVLARIAAFREENDRLNDAWLGTLTYDQVVVVNDLVNEQEYPLTDVREFAEEIDFEALTNGVYEVWCELRADSYPEEVISEFYEDNGADALINSFRNSHIGEYSSREEFIAEIMESEGVKLPGYIVVDYDATWRDLECSGYSEIEGHYFLLVS